ncbi:hypothetical protein N7461_001625 [Penicillium sp. DV-2018c]|nr:hypothetical protein N7461_001625 [Penicillium sp. DV-2018c]
MDPPETLTHAQSQGEGTGPVQYNAESLIISEPVAGPLNETFFEPRAMTNNLPYRERPSLPLDQHESGHSDGSSESQLTVVPASSFIPATSMAHFYKKYVPPYAAEAVKENFYRGEKFWNRTWDLYYLPIPKDLWEEPLILISREEAQRFIDEVNSALNLRLTLTGRGLKRALIDFNVAVVQPTFLGSCSTPEQKDHYEKQVEDFLADWPGWRKIDDKFVKRIMQSVVELRRLEGQPTNLKQEIEHKMWEGCMGQLQAHFGLRPPLQAGHEQPSLANGQVGPVDVSNVTKWDFHKAPIFISIDLEWKEDSPGALTEVGISTLDMKDLQDVPPGDYGAYWVQRIRSRHLRVTEYRTWVNHKTHRGCPDGFDFGESEMIPKANIGEVVDAAFRPPYMVPKENEPVPEHKNQERTVILVGVGLGHEVRLLKEHKSRVFSDLDHLNGYSTVIQVIVDVAPLYRAQHNLKDEPGLETMLKGLDMPISNLHNAGNDASYALQALVRFMLKVAGEKPDTYTKHKIGNAKGKDRREGATSKMWTTSSPTSN